MADNASEQQEYQDYLDYLEYQKHLGGQAAAAPRQVSGLEAFLRGTGQGVMPGSEANVAAQRASRELGDVGGARPELMSPSEEAAMLSSPELQAAKAQGAAERAQFGLPGAAGQVVGSAVGLPAQMATKAASAVPSVAKGAASALAAGQTQAAGEGRVLDPLEALLVGGVGAGGQALAAGAGKLGDVLMQQAVGRTKYTPGVGTELADEGIIGTRGMMKGQVGRAKEATYQKMLAQAKTAEQPVSSAKVADVIRSRVESMRLPTGGYRSLDLPDVQKALEYADEVAARGNVPAAEALALRRVAGEGARFNPNTAEAGKSLAQQLSKLEQAGYSQQLKEVAGLSPLDARYGALARASQALGKEQSIPQGLVGMADRVVSPLVPLSASTLGQLSAKAAPSILFGSQRAVPSLFGGRKKE